MEVLGLGTPGVLGLRGDPDAGPVRWVAEQGMDGGKGSGTSAERWRSAPKAAGAVHRGNQEVWEELWGWVQSGTLCESCKTLQEPGLGVMSSQVGETGPSLSASTSKCPIPGTECPGQCHDCTKLSCMQGPPRVLDHLLPLGSFPWPKPHHIPVMRKKTLSRVGKPVQHAKASCLRSPSPLGAKRDYWDVSAQLLCPRTEHP